MGSILALEFGAKLNHLSPRERVRVRGYRTLR
jgi:hypothetical protein